MQAGPRSCSESGWEKLARKVSEDQVALQQRLQSGSLS